MIAYLDNSATTKPCEEAVSAINKMLTESWGNPSSLHALGIQAAKEIITARTAIAESLGVSKEEIIFTSGGTEANNLALFGSIKAKKRAGNRIVTTAIEHESVLQSAEELEKQGFEVIYLKPDKFGNISKEQIFDAVNKDTILVSMMYINNEVGSVMPVKELKKAVKKANSPALIHIDCVQAYGKVNINAKKIGADLITVTAHKIHGPKGIGALYINKEANLTNQNFAMVFGGEQERKLRPGTECAPLIAGFGAAVNALPSLKEQKEKIKELNTYTKEKLKSIDGIKFNSGDNASPYIINLYIPTFMRSQTILQELSANYDVYVSNGSACSKGKKSHVLSAMGVSSEVLDKSIRISFSRYNTKKDADMLVSALKELIEKHPL
ncbi:MAG: cysteine desulfurase [Acetobacter sp.]|nr:cysteine desulfurase [Bacteroides sp.]MCM1341818.1 cysteine desulfurase [Acetobacter sp.]MCM1433984.1 cysteine desulfurase [Clostridiales bacterium]